MKPVEVLIESIATAPQWIMYLMHLVEIWDQRAFIPVISDF